MFERIADSWNADRGLWVIGAISIAVVAILCAAIAAAIAAAVADEERWQEFKEEHNCSLIEHINGDVHTGVGYGLTANGQFGAIVTTSTTPDKTVWKCDDGVTYWR